MGSISNIFLPVAIAIIMFSLGLGLRINDFTRIFSQPKDILIGLSSQIVMLPIFAFFLIIIFPLIFFDLSPELKVGIMIIAAVPGGATSNIFTSMAKGDVALSISLTAITSLICIVTIPSISIYSYFYFVGSDLDFNIWKESLKLFAIVTIPTILGMLVNNYYNNFSKNYKNSARIISIILLAVVIIGAIFKYQSDVLSYFKQAGLITLILNLSMMIIAFYIGKVFSLGKDQRKTIVCEVGLQNGTLAIVVATTIFDGGVYLVPAATYSLIMFASSLVYTFIARRN